MGAVAQCPIEVGPNFLCVLSASTMEVCSAGEAVNVRLKSGSLVRDDFRELVSSKPSQAAEEGTPLAGDS